MEILLDFLTLMQLVWDVFCTLLEMLLQLVKACLRYILITLQTLFVVLLIWLVLP